MPSLEDPSLFGSEPPTCFVTYNDHDWAEKADTTSPVDSASLGGDVG